MSIQSSSLSGGASNGCCLHSSAKSNDNNYMESVRRAADANGDGKVSKSEAQDFFRKADRNGDGQISGEEMLRALLDNANKDRCGTGAGKAGGGAGGCGGGKGSASPAAAGGGSPAQGAGSGCGASQGNGCGSDEPKLDANGDGNITIDELERFMNAPGKNTKTPPANKAGSGSMDSDGDGSLSLREFMKSMKSMQACA